MKFLNLAKFVPPALIMITAKLALTQQPPSNYQFSVISHSTTNTPVCYMQTQDGLTYDLSGICGKTPKQPILLELTRLKAQMCGSDSNCPVDVMIIK
ncbi:MAG TPA: hypothetical protein DCE56_00740 [Cyanobacteria bacterium UBA8553]|nr:hypothetical protein [Cyanobacteria bacterium UBA8553]HAJ60195.1 hypothetical protein [Cyanobacteria bacterium UBA8543]